jgi:MscS family membrane protein
MAALAENSYPLEPMDLSSPRSTLNSFLHAGDTAYQQGSKIYHGTPSRAAVHRLFELVKEMRRSLDLSHIPPALVFDISRDGIIYLYDVLSRIQLPAAEDIPDATAYTAIGNDNKTDDKPVTWTIPHTDITLIRITEGSQKGQFLFSLPTILSAKDFYQKTRSLPYRRDVPIKNYIEKRSYLSMNGWFVSAQTIEAFPDWLKISIYQQAVWKWMVLAMLIAMTFVLVLVVHKFSARSENKYIRHLLMPFVLLLVPLVFNMTAHQLTLIGMAAESITLTAELAYYILLVWIAWTGSMSVAELIIASPKITEQSLDASLIRLSARIMGIIFVISIIFYVSNNLGVPLYGLFTGLGVGGIAIALAAKPTIENFIGSLNLFADKPVRVGDFCRYGEDALPNWRRIGHIESIGIRSTRIRGIDNSITTIPNADFAMMHIVNYDIRSKMLLLAVLGLRYETTDDQMRYVIAMLRDMLLAHPRVVDEEPRVRFIGFGDYSLNVEIRVNINTSDRDEFRAINEDIYLRVMKIVKEAGTGFAFPSSTVYHSRDDGLDEELQQAAEAKVRGWCSAQELPFPNFTYEYRKNNRNTLDYPPEGSPESNE